MHDCQPWSWFHFHFNAYKEFEQFQLVLTGAINENSIEILV